MTTNTTTINNTTYDYTNEDHKPPFNFPNICHEIEILNDNKFNSEQTDEIMRLLIGKKGCNFYKITQTNNIPYIFHCRETNKIIVWCIPDKFNKVKNEIQNHLLWATNFVKNKYNNQ